MKDKFIKDIIDGYKFNGAQIFFGCGMLDAQTYPEAKVFAPLRMFNRHGLIAGATGTGKTKTLQLLLEQLSQQGVPCLAMDIKGDLSGIAMPGNNNDKIKERYLKLGSEWRAHGNPVEFLTISNEPGARMRATVTEFGPVLLSKILDLNDTQSGVISLVFKYADDNNLPLLDLKDLKRLLQYCINEGKDTIQITYGAVSAATVNTIMRKILEIEQQDGERFFGEPSFNVHDLMRKNDCNEGYISILRLADIQDRPKLFSTFMLSLLAELYATLPEAGDIDKPKLVMFIDEAHLIFNEASQALLNQIETIIKLIRSKGVGIFFVTQNPTDVPDAVLSQLGMKVQHALRAFTAKDRKQIEKTAENYPITEYYKTDEELTNLGIGEAFITCLNEKGIPTPLVRTYLCAPSSRMDILSSNELNDIVSSSEIAETYNKNIDRQSAFEMLNERIQQIQSPTNKKITQEDSTSAKKPIEEKGFLDSTLGKQVTRTVSSTLAREVARGLLGVLGIKSSTKRKSSSWF
jgi:DNA helicase HerA-like ATPase